MLDGFLKNSLYERFPVSRFLKKGGDGQMELMKNPQIGLALTSMVFGMVMTGGAKRGFVAGLSDPDKSRPEPSMHNSVCAKVGRSKSAATTPPPNSNATALGTPTLFYRRLHHRKYESLIKLHSDV